MLMEGILLGGLNADRVTILTDPGEAGAGVQPLNAVSSEPGLRSSQTP